ncbi:MAG: hypothetical protein ACYCZB_16455 [Acidiphilium sp.]
MPDREDRKAGEQERERNLDRQPRGGRRVAGQGTQYRAGLVARESGQGF